MSGTILRLSGGSVQEFAGGFASLVFTATLSEASAASVSFAWRTMGGTALGDIDYNLVTAGGVVFNPGETTKPITVSVRADTLDEIDESVIVELYNLAGGVFFDGGQATLRATGVILDDDGTGSNLALFVSSPQFVETDSGTTQAVFEVRLSREPGAAVTVNYATRNGSAVAGADYEATSGSLTFAANETVKFVTVDVVGDAIAEATEAFGLAVTPVTPGLAPARGTATILDDDSGGGAPVLSLSPGVITEFSGGFATLAFTATLSEASAAFSAFDWRIIGGTALGDLDYNLVNAGSVFFSAGETSKTFVVSVRADTLDELDESVVVELYNPDGGIFFEGGQNTLRATGVILDDDGAASNLALFVSSPQIVEGDSGFRQALFEIRLSRPATTDMAFDYATADGSAAAGSDYIARSGTVTFAAGQDTAYVVVNVAGNIAAEATEAFWLHVTPAAPGVAGASGAARILDDDSGGGAPVLSLSGGVMTEFSAGFATLSFTATLSEASAAGISFDWRTSGGTALGDVDYNLVNGGGIFFNAGETSRTFAVNVRADSLDERDESVIVELYNLEGGAFFEGGQNTLRAIGVILDDDGAASNLAILVSNPQIVEGDSGFRQALFEIRLSRPAATALTFEYATANGSALAGADYVARSGTITFAAGQDTAYVAVNVAGNGIAEATEAFSLNVWPVAPGVEPASGTATILDDDSGGGGPVLSLSGGLMTEFNAGFATLMFTATLSEASAAFASFNWRTLGGTAEADVDYNRVNAGSVTFNAGETSKSFVVNIRADAVIEPNETVIVELFNLTPGIAFAGGSATLAATGVILNDDGPFAGSGGADTLDGTEAGEALQGAGGDDLLLGRGGADTLTGGLGNDTLRGGEASDRLDGGDGNDLLEGGAGPDVLVGGNNLDEVTYVASRSGVTVNLVSGTGSGGDAAGDSLFGIESIYGSGFADILTGNAVANRLRGLGAGDSIQGGGGADTLFGDGGNDTLDGGAGADSVYGGLGDDLFIVASGADLIIEAVGQGEDTVRASGGGHFALRVNLEALVLEGAGRMDGTGNALANTITGSAGINILRGGLGDDTIAGGGGNDILLGQGGADWLRGDAGADQFRFATAADSSLADPDTLIDFTLGQDRIDLRYIDGNVAVALAYVDGAPVGAGQVGVVSLGGNAWQVQGDLDGGGADFAINLTSATGPDASWFFL